MARLRLLDHGKRIVRRQEGYFKGYAPEADIRIILRCTSFSGRAQNTSRYGWATSMILCTMRLPACRWNHALLHVRHRTNYSKNCIHHFICLTLPGDDDNSYSLLLCVVMPVLQEMRFYFFQETHKILHRSYTTSHTCFRPFELFSSLRGRELSRSCVISIDNGRAIVLLSTESSGLYVKLSLWCMERHVKILLLKDSPDDVDPVERQLRQGGIHFTRKTVKKTRLLKKRWANFIPK